MTAIKGLPLSPLAETLFVLLLFEIIREASVRMPRAVGMAMSIVGALVLGETAVNAGIISSPAVMVTALSSIALFTVPGLLGVMSVLRLMYTLIGGLCGLFGLIIAVLFTLHYMCSLNAYDAPYLAPFAPLVYADFKDAIERGPIHKMKKRPRSIPNINPTSQGLYSFPIRLVRLIGYIWRTSKGILIRARYRTAKSNATQVRPILA